MELSSRPSAMPTTQWQAKATTAMLTLGEHIVGVFWDFASLPQKPRTEEEDKSFANALKLM